MMHAPKPMQRRSRQSHDRTIEAAIAILKERGLAALTLAEVSRRARVSVGSIYGRVEDKGAFFRAVQAAILSDMERDFAAIVTRVRRKSPPLAELVPELVRETAGYLQRHAALITSLMQQGSRDPVVAKVGRHAHHENMLDFKLVLLERHAEFRHPDPEGAAATVFTVVYGTLARYLGLGGSAVEHDAASEAGWNRLINDLGFMALAFLTTEPRTGSHSTPATGKRGG